MAAGVTPTFFATASSEGGVPVSAVAWYTATLTVVSKSIGIGPGKRFDQLNVAETNLQAVRWRVTSNAQDTNIVGIRRRTRSHPAKNLEFAQSELETYTQSHRR